MFRCWVSRTRQDPGADWLEWVLPGDPGMGPLRRAVVGLDDTVGGSWDPRGSFPCVSGGPGEVRGWRRQGAGLLWTGTMC